MSGGLMDTEKGGEQTQYEGMQTELQPHKKSTGQLGDPAEQTTHDASDTSAHAQQKAERGEKTAENIRYGQAISEGGMGGMTKDQGGTAEKEGFGQVKDRAEEGGAAGGREAAGYGGKGDMDKEIGG